MGKHRNAAKSDGEVQRDASPTLLSLGGEPCDAGQDQIEEAALMEEILSQMGTSPKNALHIHMIKQITLCTIPISQVSAGSLSYPQ